jgi:hypothetical protein
VIAAIEIGENLAWTIILLALVAWFAFTEPRGRR